MLLEEISCSIFSLAKNIYIGVTTATLFIVWGLKFKMQLQIVNFLLLAEDCRLLTLGCDHFYALLLYFLLTHFQN